jgi:class 3 adenylate cyclase/predicted negative regulator of RcsB-dependent stress response
MSTASSITETAEAGRAALARYSWLEAYELLGGIRDEGVLTGQDLEGLAEAAWWSGRLDDAIAAGEGAYAAYVADDDRIGAARAALTLAKDNYTKHAAAVGAGWLARAERLLTESPESVVHGYHARLRAVLAFEGRGDLDAALQHADEALEIAARFDDQDLTALASHDRGRVLIDAGRVAEGMALMDEATATAVSGVLRPLTTGFIYCNTIGACEHIADYARAGEWTEAAKRWCERQSVAGFPGMCRVHRASIMRLRGAWAEAEDEAQRACSELVDFNPSYAAEGFYEIGEIRLRSGDYAGAEGAFRQAQELGRMPQPGLALLRLAQGRVDAAESCIRRALADETLDVLRARLLPAWGEITLAAGDLESAEKAAAELAETAERFGTPALAAMAASTLALVELEKRNPSAAITALRAAIAHWNAIDAPYEAARARLDLATAYGAAGDDHAAAEELGLAHSTFLRLGAKPDARRAEELLTRAGAATPTRLARTLMFTDICRSTELLEAIGDESWRDLLSWHDATLRSLFAEHGGEEIDHAGDGFFASFFEARAAVECAQAIQRRLAEHRRTHGFAPQLRIGLHATEATRDGTAYRGKGVHEAARIVSVAEAGEIVATCETLRAAGIGEYEPRSVKLKGLADPLEVAPVAWR